MDETQGLSGDPLRSGELDEASRRLIRERAYALWEADGRPEGRELDYWLQAEQELGNLSDAGEEDPLANLDFLVPGADRGGASS